MFLVFQGPPIDELGLKLSRHSTIFVINGLNLNYVCIFDQSSLRIRMSRSLLIGPHIPSQGCRELNEKY